MPKSASYGRRDPEDIPKKRPPARTRERRFDQLFDQATDLLDERLRTGEASPTEVTAVLRYASERERADIARIKAQTTYLEAQAEKARSEAVREEMFKKAMDAMSRYDGSSRQ